MSTGLSSFSNPQEIGALYPGAGCEWVMVIVLFALWVLWHVYQMREENKEYRDALKIYEEVGMERAMHRATGEIATEDQVRKDSN